MFWVFGAAADAVRDGRSFGVLGVHPRDILQLNRCGLCLARCMPRTNGDLTSKRSGLRCTLLHKGVAVGEKGT